MKATVIIVCVLGQAAASPALAQSAPAAVPAPAPTDPTQQAAAAGNSQDLSEIVVTAQKRSENLQRVPIAIVAATGDQLTDRGITNTLQLNTVAPGLNVRTTAGSYQPSIRGIGTSSNVVENPVALYIDGIYLPQQREGLRALNDIAQIAILKGPQGTLFGRNATGGVIQITTLAPSHTASGMVNAEIDNYATMKADAYLTGGLGADAAGSLSVSYAHQQKGWGTNITTGNDTYRLAHDFSARAKLLFQPDSRTDATLILDYMNRLAYDNSYQAYDGLPFLVPGAAPLKSVYDTSTGLDPYSAFKGGGASLTIDHDLGFAKLVAIGSYRRGDSKYYFALTPVPNVAYYVYSPDVPNQDYTAEIQLVSSKAGRFYWTVGAFYINSSLGAEPILRSYQSGPFAPLSTSPTLTSTSATETTDSVAPFGQASFKIFDRTTLTAGVRYTYEKRTLSGASIVTTLINGTTTQRLIPDASQAIRKPTFRASLDQQITDSILGYVSFNTGFKSGGYNTVSPANPAYLPEKLLAYEAGVKTQLLANRLRLNVAGFYYDYTNLQVIQFVGFGQQVVNGPKARLYGLDLDFEARLATGLQVSGGVELEHATFVSYPNAVFGMPRPGGGTITFPGDASGNRLPLAQNATATTSIDYHHDISRGSLDFNITGNYNGDYRFEADNFLRQNAYVILNTSLRWNLPGDRVALTLFGKNLFDEHVITQTSTQTGGYPTTYGMAPRTYGIAAHVKF